MRWMLNILYLSLLTLLSPFIVWRTVRHGRYRRGLSEKLFGRLTAPHDNKPVAWFHAVSVGEVIQLQKVVAEFRRQSGDCYSILITTSTDTGFDLARQRFSDCHITWFPLDFSWAVKNAVQTIRPAIVCLMELELWPNFLMECESRGIPVAVVNARLSEKSHRRYQRVSAILRPMFASLDLVAAQSVANGERLLSLGVLPERMHTTGSIKFDGVETKRDNPKTRSLRTLFGLSDRDLVLVAGSTQDPEESLILECWKTLRKDCPALRLILVPRHKERFDEVAAAVEAQGFTVVRRSQLESSPFVPSNQASPSVGLLDTIGELGACWGLADIAFVGGSFGNRGGQNMIEPAAYGAAVMFGPNTWNFRDVVQIFKEADACRQLTSPEELSEALRQFLSNTSERQELGRKAQQTVLNQQGATSTTARLLLQLVTPSSMKSKAA